MIVKSARTLARLVRPETAIEGVAALNAVWRCMSRLMMLSLRRAMGVLPVSTAAAVAVTASVRGHGCEVTRACTLMMPNNAATTTRVRLQASDVRSA